MAGVEAPRVGGVAEQLALVAALRLTLFRNSLRSWRGQVNLVANLVALGLVALAALGLGLGMGAGAFLAAARGRWPTFVWLLWGVFVTWHFFSVIFAVSTVDFEFRSLLRYPLRFSAFFTVSLAYGLLEPAAVVALFWLFCLGAGLAAARPDLLGWAVALLVFFGLANLLLNRWLLTWLERLMARRRTREAIFFVFLLASLGFAAGGVIFERMEDRAENLVRSVLMTDLLPPGMTGRALQAAARGETQAFAARASGLLLFAVAFGFFLGKRLHAQYRGEDLGESEAARVRAQPEFAGAIRDNWFERLLPPPAAAVFDKEWRYFLRSGPAVFTVLVPLAVIVFISASFGRPRPEGVERPFFERVPELMFPLAVAYGLLLLAPLAHNTFSHDGRGIQLLLAAPVRFRDVLLAKNLLHGVVMAVEAVLAWGVVSLLVRPPGAAVVVATFAALLYATLAHFIAGNLLSLWFPRRFDFQKFRAQAAGVTMLAGVGVQIVVLGTAAGVFYLAHREGWMWLAAIVLLALSLVLLWLYVSALGRSDRVAAAQREVLLAELSR